MARPRESHQALRDRGRPPLHAEWPGQTLLIIAGVALGGAVITFMSALLAGLQANLFRRTLNYQAPIVSPPAQRRLRGRCGMRPRRRATCRERSRAADATAALSSINGKKVRDDSRAHCPMSSAITPVVSGPAFAIRGELNKAVSIAGIEPGHATFDVIALHATRWWRDTAVDVGSDILIGTELAQGPRCGPRATSSGHHRDGARRVAAVVGIFDFGNKGVNGPQRLRDAARRAEPARPGRRRVEPSTSTSRTPFAAEPGLAQGRGATTRTSNARQLDRGPTRNSLRRSRRKPMSNNFIRSLRRAHRSAPALPAFWSFRWCRNRSEIGILRAMGTSRSQVLRLFLIQGAVMGLAGSVFGSLLGARLPEFLARHRAERRWHADVRRELRAVALRLRSCRCNPDRHAGGDRSRAPRRSARSRRWRSVAESHCPTKRFCASRVVRKSYAKGTAGETEVLHGIDLAAGAWRVRRADRAVGIGQEHAPEPDRTARSSRRRARADCGFRVDAPSTTRSERVCADGRSVSCSSITICCPNSPRWKTS